MAAIVSDDRNIVKIADTTNTVTAKITFDKTAHTLSIVDQNEMEIDLKTPMSPEKYAKLLEVMTEIAAQILIKLP